MKEKDINCIREDVVQVMEVNVCFQINFLTLCNERNADPLEWHSRM